MEVEAMSGSGYGPAPFLLKTYDMVDDSSTDHIVSWSSNNSSFVVWDPPEFSRLLLPTYFKHNNFSSFIRQLNTYGFRKIDPERWEFGNEDFVKDQKYLLKNIRRRKPMHSHSNLSMDSERIAFDQEIERLSLEKKELEAKIASSKRRNSAAKLRFEDLMLRVTSLEERQDAIFSAMEKGVKFPTVLEYLTQKIESIDFAASNKTRTFPHLDSSNELAMELSPAASSAKIQLDSRKSGTVSVAENSDVGEERCDDHVSFHLNLTLASSMLRSRVHGSSEEVGEKKISPESSSKTSSSLKEVQNRSENHGRVNDLFWEQFLTERPGSSDNDDASSNRMNDDQRIGSGIYKNTKNMEQLTL